MSVEHLNDDPRMARRERVRWDMVLDAKEYIRVKDDVDTLLASSGVGVGRMAEGDRLDLHYEFSIEYWGNVARNLEIIERLIDAGIMTSVSQGELFHGRCLIRDVLAKLERLAAAVQLAESGHVQHVAQRAAVPNQTGWLRRCLRLVLRR